MKKTFDDLFNEFIHNDESDSPLKRSDIKKTIETIANFKKFKKGEISEENVYKELGDPTTTEEYIDNGLKYVRLIWDTPQGQFIKVVVSDILPEEVPLEKQLALAVEKEDYPKAIEIRDEIKKRAEKK